MPNYSRSNIGFLGSILFSLGLSGCFSFIGSQQAPSSNSSSVSSASPVSSVQSTPTPCIDSTFIDNSLEKFTAFQSLPSTLTWNSVNSWLTMNSTTSDTLTSRVMVGCSDQTTWSKLSWMSTFPTNKELSNNGQSESTTNYSGLSNSSLMANIAGLWHLNETSGSYADSSGNNNTATDTGSTWGSGNNGKFDNAAIMGAGKYITAPGSASLSPSAAISASFWLKANGAVPDEAGLLGYTTADPNPLGWQVYVRTNRPNLVYRMSDFSIYFLPASLYPGGHTMASHCNQHHSGRQC